MQPELSYLFTNSSISTYSTSYPGKPAKLDISGFLGPEWACPMAVNHYCALHGSCHQPLHAPYFDSPSPNTFKSPVVEVLVLCIIMTITIEKEILIFSRNVNIYIGK